MRSNGGVHGLNAGKLLALFGLIPFRVDGVEHTGAQGDPVAALLTCSPVRAWTSVINGRVVVDDGVLLGVDLPQLVARHNAASRRLLEV